MIFPLGYKVGKSHFGSRVEVIYFARRIQLKNRVRVKFRECSQICKLGLRSLTFCSLNKRKNQPHYFAGIVFNWHQCPIPISNTTPRLVGVIKRLIVEGDCFTGVPGLTEDTLVLFIREKAKVVFPLKLFPGVPAGVNVSLVSHDEVEISVKVDKLGAGVFHNRVENGSLTGKVSLHTVSFRNIQK